MSIDDTYVTTSSTVQRLTACPSPQGMCPQSDGHLTGGGLAAATAAAVAAAVDVPATADVVAVVVVAAGDVSWTGLGVWAGVGGPAAAVVGLQGIGDVIPSAVILLGFGDTLPGLRGRLRGAYPLEYIYIYRWNYDRW